MAEGEGEAGQTQGPTAQEIVGGPTQGAPDDPDRSTQAFGKSTPPQPYSAKSSFLPLLPTLRTFSGAYFF